MPHPALAAVVALSAVALIDNERVPCMHIKKPECANTSPRRTVGCPFTFYRAMPRTSIWTKWSGIMSGALAGQDVFDAREENCANASTGELTRIRKLPQLVHSFIRACAVESPGWHRNN
jgi:hypothetical protein